MQSKVAIDTALKIATAELGIVDLAPLCWLDDGKHSRTAMYLEEKRHASVVHNSQALTHTGLPHHTALTVTCRSGNI